MDSEQSARRPRGTRRRKVALACEPCRERKSRCDGEKPVCAACMRRALPMGRCVYKAENARSASSEQYLHTLHQRIRELEANAAALSSAGSTCERPDDTIVGDVTPELSAPRVATSENLNAVVDRHQPSPSDQNTHNAGLSHTTSSFESPSNITGMGAMTNGNGYEQFQSQNAEYFGSSSAASLMSLLTRDTRQQNRHAWALQKIPPPDVIGDSQFWGRKTPSLAQVEDSLLPPRHLADHLLECFWDRVYCLHPFFDRCSFQQAYENLWVSRSHISHEHTDLNVGLGDRYNSGPDSIVFICALNSIFALGCHFSDIPIQEREAIVHQFFLRAKRHIGLDLVDIHSIGVVQTLLIVALFMQSTPYPHRCWNSIGMACRLALGLGLHEEKLEKSKQPLEQEIHRRTWHGCVIMDMTVSMTYGRPSMTSHITTLPLPGLFDLESRQELACPSLIAFYISTIKLYSILDSILSDVYNTWEGRSHESTLKKNPNGLDVIIRLEESLLQYEASVPPFLSWKFPSTLTVESANEQILSRQRNVLHCRFLYLQILLYRPILVKLCFDGHHDESGSNSLHSFIFSKCAVGCIQAAVDLISLVYETHRTATTDTWWYNGFYTSTSAIVLIMSYICRAAGDFEKPAIDLAWQKVEQILLYMTSFSISGRNTLSFLQAIRNQVLSNSNVGQTAPRNSRQASENPHSGQKHTGVQDPSFGESQPFIWDGGFPQDELGFLGPFDLSEFQDWFPQIPL